MPYSRANEELDNQRLRTFALCTTTSINLAVEDFRRAVVGRKVRILSNYNGQMYGRSKRSQHGQIVTIKQAHLSALDNWCFQLEEFASGHPFIQMKDVEFVSSPSNTEHSE